MRNFILLFILLVIPTNAFAEASRSFDGTDDEISIGNVLNITTGNGSWGAWTKTTEDASNDTMIGKQDNGSNDGWALHTSTTDPGQANAGDGTEEAGCTGVLDPDGTWVFYVATWDGTANTIVLYANGTQDCTNTTANVDSITTVDNLQIGETDDDLEDMNGLVAYAFVDNTRILAAWEIAESQWKPDYLEITAGFWPLWGDSTEIDLSANANSGTIVAGTTASSDGPPVMFGGGMPL